MRRKILTIGEIGAQKHRISWDIYWHLCCPTLERIASLRDTFWRLALNHEGFSAHWVRDAFELETILENYHDYSI